MSGASWTYDTAKDSELSFVDRLKECPREPDPLVYAARVAAALAIRATLRICHHFDIVGREHLPREGSFVLVSNHASHLDALALLSALPLRSLHRAYPLAARDYFGASDFRLAVTTIAANVMLFDRTTTVAPGPGSLSPLSLTRPLDEADKDETARTRQCRRELERCKQMLDNSGNVLVMFPEGTRSLDGRVGVFRRGIGLLLAGTRYPALPCYLDGTFRAWRFLL
jgi:1-acyl-sn-glycerol-3-phosphate acyltransferase